MSESKTPAPIRPGTYASVQQIAGEEINEHEQHAIAEAQPHLDLLFRLVVGAWGHALDIAKMSRLEKVDAYAFVFAAAHLREYLQRLRKVDIAGLMEHWPKNPGTIFSCKAGDSALDAAMIFSKSIETAIFSTCGLSRYALAGEVVSPNPSPPIRAWCERAMGELRTKTLPTPPAWPMWEIHRDLAALESRLLHEYAEAMKVSVTPAQSATMDRDDQPIYVDEIIERLIGYLNRAEAIRLRAETAAQQAIAAGKANELQSKPASILGSSNELVTLKRRFDAEAMPFVQVGYAFSINAADLENFICSGKPELVPGAIHVLREIQGEATRRRMKASAGQTELSPAVETISPLSPAAEARPARRIGEQGERERIEERREFLLLIVQELNLGRRELSPLDLQDIRRGLGWEQPADSLQVKSLQSMPSWKRDALDESRRTAMHAVEMIARKFGFDAGELVNEATTTDSTAWQRLDSAMSFPHENVDREDARLRRWSWCERVTIPDRSAPPAKQYDWIHQAAAKLYGFVDRRLRIAGLTERMERLRIESGAGHILDVAANQESFAIRAQYKRQHDNAAMIGQLIRWRLLLLDPEGMGKRYRRLNERLISIDPDPYLERGVSFKKVVDKLRAQSEVRSVPPLAPESSTPAIQSRVEAESSMLELLPLNDTERAVFDLIRGQKPGEGIQGAAICRKLDGTSCELTEDHLYGKVIKRLKQFGIRNRRSVGYYFDPSAVRLRPD